MENSTTHNDQTKEDKQKAFWERARKGVLRFLNDRGGKLPMLELHDYSMKTYLIQHQSFSSMMESFVNEGLVTFDRENSEATITEIGQQFIK